VVRGSKLQMGRADAWMACNVRIGKAWPAAAGVYVISMFYLNFSYSFEACRYVHDAVMQSQLPGFSAILPYAQIAGLTERGVELVCYEGTSCSSALCRPQHRLERD